MEIPSKAQMDAFVAEREEKDRLEQLIKRHDFDRLYFRWLEARATLENPDLDNSDVAMNAK
jgi:hypothetical protein